MKSMMNERHPLVDPAHATPVLKVEGLSVVFDMPNSTVTALDDISFEIGKGEVLGVIGESGAGKSLLGSAIVGLLEPPGRISAGKVSLAGYRIDNLSQKKLQRVRGKDISMVFQDPLTSLDPLYTVGDQLIETIRTHSNETARAARERAVKLLHEVGIPSPEQRIDSYPHELSGGMRQRVVIALALCLNPLLIIADEPTTALDVSVQAQIIALLKRVARDHGTAIMLVTHDMGVIAEVADRVAVLYGGRVSEIGPVKDLIQQALHPYTQGLMGAIPSIAHDRAGRMVQIPGSMPRLAAMPEGCYFNPRCAHAWDLCRSSRPKLIAQERSQIACHLYEYGDAPHQESAL